MAKYKPKYLKATAMRKSSAAIPVVMLTLFSLLLVSLAWGVAARYTQQEDGDFLVKAEEFYFSSDYLTEDGASYTINPGSSSSVAVTLEVRNYEGLKTSEADITYEIQGTSSGTDTVVPTPQTGTLTGGSEVSQTVVLEGLIPGNIYTVTAIGTGGFQKTLSAEFIVAKNTEGVYKNTKIYDDYVLLTVWTLQLNVSKAEAVVFLPDGLIPDSTDSRLAAIYTDGDFTGGNFDVELGSHQSCVYRFFITEDYDGSDIRVTVGSTVLEETDLK